MVRIEDLLYSCLEAGSARDQRLEQLCRSHPGHADELRRMLAELSALGFLAAGAPGGGAMPATPTHVGSYRVEELIGRGGMGLVYRGRQPSLGDRPVAVKMIRPELVADPRAEARFLREALLASKLDHPSLCQVLDFGRHEGLPYLVMPLVEGSTLAQRIAAAKAGSAAAAGAGLQLGATSTGLAEPPWARIAATVEKLARGLHAAHEKGLVHRDVKPGNVMIRADGEPVLLDFGLACARDADAEHLTLSHEVLGTPAYMAPEQIEPRGRAVDARTDVYGLGVLLYECLALRLPHEGASRDQLARRILHDPPSDVRRHQPAVPRDLAIVLQVALEKSPDRRYASALLLADDLQRVRARVPILARRPRAAVRAWRWVERNPWPTAAGVALLLGLVMAIGLLAQVRAQATRSRALALVGASQAAAGLDQSLSLQLAIAGADVAPELTQTHDQLHRAARNMHEVAIVGGFVGDVVAAGFDRDGSRTFAVGYGGGLMVGDRAGRVQFRRELEVAVETALPVEVDGALALVAACADGRVRLWRPGRAPDVTTLGPALEPVPGALLFSTRGDVARDGRSVLFGTRHGHALVLSIPDGEILHDITMTVAGRGNPIPVASCAFAGADGLVLGGAGGWIQYWRGGDQLVHTFRHPSEDKVHPVSRIIVDGSGARAVAMVPGRPRLLACMLGDGRSELLEAQPLGLRELVAARDGATFASGANDGAVAVWRFGEDRPRRVLQGHRANITALAFSADSQRIVSGAEDRTVRLWEASGHPLIALAGHRARITAVAVDPSADLILSASADATARLWRLAEGLPVARHPQHGPESFGRFCFGSAPETIWIGDNMTGRVWRADWRTGSLQQPGLPEILDPSLLHIDVDRAGARVLVGRERMVELLDVGTGALLGRYEGRQMVGADLSDDGARVVAVQQGGVLQPPWLCVLAVRNGRLEAVLEQPLDAWDRSMPYLNRADLSPDERSVVVCRADGTVRIYDLEGRALSEPLDHSAGTRFAPYRGTLSRDSSRLLTAGTDGQVKYWIRDGSGRWQGRLLTKFDARVKSAYFDGEETRVVAGADDGVLRVVDLDGRVLHQFERRESAFQCVRFSADGRAVVATMLDGRLLSWLLDLGELQAAAQRLVIRDLTPAERTAWRELLGDEK